MELLFATNNRHKLEELTQVLEPYGINVHSLSEYPALQDIPETADTLVGNALIKAYAGFEHTGLPTIADDTGLEVDALDGAPGVHSARYAGADGNFDANIKKLLQALEHTPDNQRTARFRTAAVFVDQDHEIVARGEVAGEITRQRFGSQGFGYDPVFRVIETGRTFAQMSLEEKNELSHRQRAFTALLARLQGEHEAFSTEQPIQ